MRWIVISLLVLAAILFGYSWYKVNKLAQSVECLYIPVEVTNPYCLELK